MEENKRNEELKKRVDEAWKDSIKKEAESAEKPAGQLPEVTFHLFATGLMMEALVALGDVENPITNKKESNTQHAKFIIDTLAMLQEKTRNNLSNDEQEMLESILYDLRMRFIGKTQKTGA